MKTCVLTSAIAAALALATVAAVFGIVDGLVASPALRIGSGATAVLFSIFAAALMERLWTHLHTEKAV